MRGNEIKDTPKYLTRYDYILLDAGGRDSTELRLAMVVSDAMLTPVRAAQYDVSSLGRLDAILDELRDVKELPVYAIINSLKTHPNMPEFTEAVEAIEQYDNIKPLSFAISDRIAFARSAAEGRGVHEMPDADQKAIAEMKTLYQTIYG
jgi:chromosome partitioning protein